jgi:hypothetical protein
MSKDEQELGLEDLAFEETMLEDDRDLASDAALLDEDEAEGEFVASSVDADDLSSGFGATIARREVDVDEDTQGDEGAATNGQVLLTVNEVPGEVGEVSGDEIELDLEDALTSGRTAVEAPDRD